MKRLLLIICFVMVMFQYIGYAGAAEWDNTLDYEKAQDKITIRNALGLPNWLGGSTLIEATLDENGCDADGRFCEATKTITINGEMELVQDFRTLINDKDGEEENIRWHKFEYWGEIDDYEVQCVNGKEHINGTIERNCNSVKVGSHQGWIEFYEGDIFQPGTYEVRTSGEIKPGRVYDWQVKFAGKWTTPWEIWGNISLGDDAEILLNSPIDNFLTPTSSVTFNCSLNITGGASAVNMSTLNNESGTFEIKNTTFFDVESLGLISYYKFDGATGTNALDSVGPNNGTTSGVTRNVTGIINKSFDFESNDPDFVDLNAAVIPTGASDDFTISAWINPESSNGSELSIVNQNSGGAGRLILNIDGTRHIRIFIGGTSFTSTEQVSLATWSHIVAKRTGTNVSLWIDSAHVGSMSKGDGIDNTNMEVGRASAAAGYFDGLIDEVAFYNRSIDASEISDIYNNGSATRPGVPTATTQTWVRTINETILWTCQGCDSDGDCGFATTNRTVITDITAPLIDVEAPSGILDHGVVGGNELLNITFTDPGLDNCWFNYNGTNITISGCETGVKNSTNFTLEINNKNMTAYANDTLGNENSTFISWDYKILELSQTFQNTSIEGNLQNISSIVNLGSGITISSVILDYNGTFSTGTISTSGGNTTILKSNLITPGVSSDQNITFHWSVVLSGGEIINLTEQNQTILNLGIDNCSSFTNQIMNITIVDEERQTILSNTTFEISLNILSSDRSLTIITFSQEFNDTNPISICLDQSILAGVEYSMDSIMRYTAQEYANEYYNIVNQELTNETEIQNITLYDLNETDSTEFQLTFNGEDALPVENALIFIDRQFIAEDTFKTVELPKTDSNGQTVLHLVRNDIIYNIRVIKNDEVLGNFLNIIAFCQDFTIGSCTLNLNSLSNNTLIFNYDEATGIIYDRPPTYNESTNRVSFTFASTSGNAELVSMVVERNDVFGNRTVCTNSVLTASGTLSCDIGVNISDTNLVTKISIDEEEWINSNVVIDDTAYGSTGYVMFFILSLAIILMLSESKTGVLVGISLNFVFGVSLGWVIGGIAGIGSAGIWILIISVVGIWKLNKDRKS